VRDPGVPRRRGRAACADRVTLGSVGLGGFFFFFVVSSLLLEWRAWQPRSHVRHVPLSVQERSRDEVRAAASLEPSGLMALPSDALALVCAALSDDSFVALACTCERALDGADPVRLLRCARTRACGCGGSCAGVRPCPVTGQSAGFVRL
jgi:hypothetical protein